MSEAIPIEEGHLVDLNLAAYESGELIEVQGTAEGKSYSQEELMTMTSLALTGIQQIAAIQREVLRGAGINLDALIDRREDLN